VKLISCTDAVISPYVQSDINSKAYPPGGGTVGLHYDTNGITVLLFLTTNKEGPLRLNIPRSHPSKKSLGSKNGTFMLVGALCFSFKEGKFCMNLCLQKMKKNLLLFSIIMKKMILGAMKNLMNLFIKVKLYKVQ